MKSLTGVVAMLLVGFGLMAGAPAAASSGISIVVNGLPITTYDIQQRARLNRLTGQNGSNEHATDELIDEAVQLYEAARVGIRPSEAQVDRAFASVAASVKLSPSQLVQALSQNGVAASSLRARLRAAIAWQGLVQQHMQENSPVRPEDVISQLLAQGPVEEMTMGEYTLQQIIFVVPEGSSSAYVQQRQREANAFRSRFTGCDNSLEQARQLHDVVVRPMGRRDSTQLSGPQGEEIEATEAGHATPPHRTNLGVELVAVCSVRQIQSTAAARDAIEQKLAIAQQPEIGKELLAELRAKAIIEHR
jgi:peptidyl-prolyl cis-trans isomerase SurA